MKQTITVRGKRISVAGLIWVAFFAMQIAFQRHRHDGMFTVCVVGLIASLVWALGLRIPRDSSKPGK
jgi:hypothetical protein